MSERIRLARAAQAARVRHSVARRFFSPHVAVLAVASACTCEHPPHPRRAVRRHHGAVVGSTTVATLQLAVVQ